MASVHLLLLKGHPATGKSTLGRALARHLSWPLIDKDDVKDFVADVPGGNHLAYEISWRLIDTQLSLGISTIVDTPLSYPTSYGTGCMLARRHGARLLVVETVLDETVWRQRLNRRQAETHSSHRVSSWHEMQELLRRYAGCWQYPIDPAHHLRVDTKQEIPNLIQTVCTALRAEVSH